MPAISPAKLIYARSEAFNRGDFGYIYDSCHSESNFRSQFTDRDEYIGYGESTLVQDFRILNCQVLADDLAADEARVIFLMEVEVHGEVQRYAELAWLRQEGKVWRYHRGLKMTADELPPHPERITFADFNKLDASTIF